MNLAMLGARFISDETLVIRALRGDHRAFTALLERHGARVFHLLRRLTTSCETAEDLTQETFIAAYRALDTWRAGSTLSTWLCGIAVRRYTASRRRHINDPHIENFEDAESTAFLPNDDPLAHCKRREAEDALANAISELSESYREVFVLVRIEDMSYQQVADLLGIPLGTVQSRLHRATRSLHQRLSPLIYGTERVPVPHPKQGAKHDIRKES